MPNWERAFVEKAKLYDYLLDLRHREGGSKARFFHSLGYTREEWQALARDLVTQIAPLDVSSYERNEFGSKFVIIGVLKGPQGSGAVLTVWFIDVGETNPRLVSAYPSDKS